MKNYGKANRGKPMKDSVPFLTRKKMKGRKASKATKEQKERILSLGKSS